MHMPAPRSCPRPRRCRIGAQSHVVSQRNGLTQDTIPNALFQTTRRGDLSEYSELVLDPKSEPRHVKVAVPAIDVDQQIQVTIWPSLPARDRTEDPNVAYTEALG